MISNLFFSDFADLNDMELSLRSPSTSQWFALPPHVLSFTSEESTRRAVRLACHTHLKLVLLGISFTNSSVDRQRRSRSTRSSGIAVGQQCRAENFAPASGSLCSRLSSGKYTLSVDSTRCRACGETSGATSGASSTCRVTGVENIADRVVTHACGQNGTKVENQVAIVWFKHDLRMDDHVGLASAKQYDHVVPLFIFDSVFYAGTLPIKFIAMPQFRDSDWNRETERSQVPSEK